MINLITNEKALENYLRFDITDSGIEVAVDKSLTTKEYVGIKVDDFYNDIMPMCAPKSVDFIVSVDCQCNVFSLYILELKNVKKSKNLKISDIHEKFDTTINDFINVRFKHIFLNPAFKYKKINLYLIGDIYGEKGKTTHHNVKLRDSLKTDMSLSSKNYKIHGKLCTIKYDIPPNPLIKKDT